AHLLSPQPCLHPIPPPCPYTTLFRSNLDAAGVNFTRNGSFLVDSDRYVTDSQGGYLQVYPVDGSGAVIATGLGSTVNLRLPQTRSEEHTSELQSRENLVCRLLLEKKN